MKQILVKMVKGISIRRFQQGDLSEGDLSKGDLSKGDLSKGDLSKGDLSKGDLSEGDLSEGDLIRKMKSEEDSSNLQIMERRAK
ncbi:hypothetical protein BC938DRAFT_483102, partial [Jimgerdemannia flammicorona]